MNCKFLFQRLREKDMYKMIYRDVNILSQYCGPRDINKLNQEEVHNVIGRKQADVMVLFGGSIMPGCNYAKKNVSYA